MDTKEPDNRRPPTQNCITEQLLHTCTERVHPREARSPREPQPSQEAPLSVLAAGHQAQIASHADRHTHSRVMAKQKDASTECPGHKWTGQHSQWEVRFPHRVCVIDTENLYRPTHLAPLARNARQALQRKRQGRGQDRIPAEENQPQSCPQ